MPWPIRDSPQRGYRKWASEAKVWSVKREFCDCLDDPKPGEERRELSLHLAELDTQCRGWQRLLELIDKDRPPFPRLPQWAPAIMPDRCSVCEGPFGDEGPHQVWISLRVGSDVLPLLVHACIAECLRNLPTSPEGYVAGPHYGGPDLVQPPPRF